VRRESRVLVEKKQEKIAFLKRDAKAEFWLKKTRKSLFEQSCV